LLDIKNLKTLAGLTQKLRFLPFLFEISSVLLENALRALSDKTSVIMKRGAIAAFLFKNTFK